MSADAIARELERRAEAWANDQTPPNAVERMRRYDFLIGVVETILSARSEGYRQGLEDAAQIADSNAHEECEVAEAIARTIRALNQGGGGE